MAAVAPASIPLKPPSRPQNQEQHMFITEAGRYAQMRRKLILLLSGLSILATAGFAAAQQNAPTAGGAPAAQAGQRPAPPPLRLTSTDISDGKPIAAKYTCAAGTDAVSPALQ